MHPNKRKAIALLSGGLDSALAARMMLDQGVEVIGLHLSSPFGCATHVEAVAKQLGIALLVRDKGEAYLDVVADPQYGYGKHMNPCVDCRIYMFHLAQKVLNEIGADFVVTGEVIGQRPMSQVRRSLELIDQDSALPGLVLRPLSAHSLEETIPEKEGWVDRDRLFSITGRGRTRQLDLAAEWGITEYAQPGGGCLLTEGAFEPRLRDFFSRDAKTQSQHRLKESGLLRVGRHFRFTDDAKAVIARNERENHLLESWSPSTRATLLKSDNFSGPHAVLLGGSRNVELTQVARLLARYGKPREDDTAQITYEGMLGTGILNVDRAADDAEVEAWKLS